MTLQRSSPRNSRLPQLSLCALLMGGVATAFALGTGSINPQAQASTATGVHTAPAPPTGEVMQDSAAAAPATMATQRKAKESIPSELVTITPRGFEPAEMILTHERFFLVVENRSGRSGLTLRFNPEHGRRIVEAMQPEDQLDWADELKLSPGRYTLTAAENPQWVCQVTVTAE